MALRNLRARCTDLTAVSAASVAASNVGFDVLVTLLTKSHTSQLAEKSTSLSSGRRSSTGRIVSTPMARRRPDSGGHWRHCCNGISVRPTTLCRAATTPIPFYVSLTRRWRLFAQLRLDASHLPPHQFTMNRCRRWLRAAKTKSVNWSWSRLRSRVHSTPSRRSY